MALTDLLCIELGELLLCAGEADLESFDLTKPSLLFCFGDSGDQVVADLDEAVSLSRIRSEHGASNTRVLVDAGSSECASADSDGQFASLEMPEEGIPFLVGGRSVPGP
ncbi:hypothetical protein ACWGIV_25770 [Streptomyces sp. NPDC054844]